MRRAGCVHRRQRLDGQRRMLGKGVVGSCGCDRRGGTGHKGWQERLIHCGHTHSQEAFNPIRVIRVSMLTITINNSHIARASRGVRRRSTE